MAKLPPALKKNAAKKKATAKAKGGKAAAAKTPLPFMSKKAGAR